MCSCKPSLILRTVCSESTVAMLEQRAHGASPLLSSSRDNCSTKSGSLVGLARPTFPILSRFTKRAHMLDCITHSIKEIYDDGKTTTLEVDARRVSSTHTTDAVVCSACSFKRSCCSARGGFAVARRRKRARQGGQRVRSQAPGEGYHRSGGTPSAWCSS